MEKQVADTAESEKRPKSSPAKETWKHEGGHCSLARGNIVGKYLSLAFLSRVLNTQGPFACGPLAAPQKAAASRIRASACQATSEATNRRPSLPFVRAVHCENLQTSSASACTSTPPRLCCQTHTVAQCLPRPRLNKLRAGLAVGRVSQVSPSSAPAGRRRSSR